MIHDPGSFRDPSSRVFYEGGEVRRGLDSRAAAAWRAVSASRFFQNAVAQGRVIGTAEAPPGPAAGGEDGAWALVLRHERVPFVSYPFEWTFSMLQDAALLQLSLLREALEEGFTLKDATPYNVQWVDARPVFIDVASFEPLPPGGVWDGYRQFCELNLFPLMLQAYRGLPLQPLLRGRLDGMSAADFSRAVSWRDLLRPGVWAHGVLHAALQSRTSGDDGDLRSEIREAGLAPEHLARNARRLERLVAGLRWDPPATPWSEYAGEAYSEADRALKEGFVRESAAGRRWDLAWDLGGGTGRHARLLGGCARTTVVLDVDASACEAHYRALRADKSPGVLPLVVDLADPSPGLGWRGRERRPLEERGRPGLVMALAFLHHLCLGRGVPAAEAVDWLASMGAELLVEFIDPADPMARRLAARRGVAPADYTRDAFDALLRERFEVLRRLDLSGGLRALYHARPRSP